MHKKNSFITTIQGIRNMLNECELMCNTALRLYENKEFEDVIRLISEKIIDVEKYIDARVELDKAQESFERLTSGVDSAIKIVFKP